MVLLWLLLTISKIVIVNGANLEESMIEEKHLQSRYQYKGEWFQRLDIVMLQAIDVLKLVQWIYPSFSVVFSQLV